MQIPFIVDDGEKNTAHETSNTLSEYNTQGIIINFGSNHHTSESLCAKHTDVPTGSSTLLTGRIPQVGWLVCLFVYILIWPQDLNLRLSRFSCTNSQTCLYQLHLL